MKKIKVNDYVRTKKGYIGRVIRFDEDNNLFCDNIISDMCGEKFRWLNKLEQKEQIKKHSSNIIDLIEVGDILEIEDYGDISYLGWDKDTTTLSYKDMIEDIKKGKVKLLGIVTRQQFNSMKYEVE